MRQIRAIISLAILTLIAFGVVNAQNPTMYIPDRVFDGQEMKEKWVVVIEGNIIKYTGPRKDWSGDVDTKIMEGTTLLPGLIEGHAHMFLYPYDQSPWNDQVLKESESYRMVRAVVHAERTLLAGFTTVRDLGTEGAGYADASLKKAIDDGVVPGPRLLISSKAIVATGSYGPKGFADHFDNPLGAEVADGYDNIIKVVRDQIGHGADFIKVYADYRWGPNGEALPTFSEEELKLMVQTAESSGRYVVAHASTPEGMRRAIRAGVESIEHGDGGNEGIWNLMKEKNVALCPTLAAGDAIMQYQGWKKGIDADPQRIIDKKNSFSSALKSGVTIVAGGDVGVFEHGDNVRELEMMVNYGMSPEDVLRSVTSTNAQIFHLSDKVGSIKNGLFADLVAVKGNPAKNISNLRNVVFVMKDGEVVLDTTR
ncbi:MAG: amidohydrolase family protein [Saprospiraceae bacterium]|nr:amidohydrolase family protein [Saprospiraceae bacterium]